MSLKKDADVIVIGVGGMGSAACYHLAKAGAKVIGLEQYNLGHALGSSHGETRLIRQAYFEHPDYVPLLKRAYQLWHMAEVETQRPLYWQTGLVIFGKDPQSDILRGIRQSSKLHQIPIEELTAHEARKRFNQFKITDDLTGIFEPTGGYLAVEACVLTHAELARKHGAVLYENVQVIDWAEEKDSIMVRTNSGVYTAAQLVITAGPWSQKFIHAVTPSASKVLKVRRVPQLWFGAGEAYKIEQGMPCFAFDTEQAFFYGFPRLTDHIKVAAHKPGELVQDPAQLDRSLRQDDLDFVTNFVQTHLPGAQPKAVRQAVCMYTMTPDEHFIIDRKGNVTYAAGFSGHGFKFASVIGEILSQLALQGSTPHPIEFLRPRWPTS